MLKVVDKPLKIGNYHCDINSVCYDPQGKYLAIGANDGSNKVYNALTGKAYTELNSN